jgi:hypothetical protein
VFRTAHNSFFSLLADHRSFLVVVLRLRPALIRASRVLPSTPPLFHRVDRHFLDGLFGGFSVSGIHLCPQTSQTRSIESEPRLRRYTRPTTEIRNSGLMDSSVCGYRGEAFFDQRLIPLGFARSFAAGGQEIAKVGSMSGVDATPCGNDES